MVSERLGDLQVMFRNGKEGFEPCVRLYVKWRQSAGGHGRVLLPSLHLYLPVNQFLSPFFSLLSSFLRPLFFFFVFSLFLDSFLHRVIVLLSIVVVVVVAHWKKSIAPGV